MTSLVLIKKIAVLLTCYNRIEKTLNCLDSFSNSMNSLKLKIAFDIYIVDDGSTDGTSEVISRNYPEINLIKGWEIYIGPEVCD